MSHAPSLERTPLYECHRRAGARLVDFAGWEMPERYAGVIAEHHAVRQAAGLFDVSHMGEIRVRGRGALALLQALTPNDVTKLRPGRAHYSGLLTPAGTYVDDLLVYQLADEDYLLVVNAANAASDFAWISEHTPQDADCSVDDVSSSYALLALQGPRALAILSSLTAEDLAAIRYYHFKTGQVSGATGLISRTGYTGEDGFELYLDPADAPRIWDELLRVGAGLGLVPAGLGARDTLRLEAGMALYGHEINRDTTPYEAGLGWVVKLDKGPFIGREALAAQLQQGPQKQLIGFEICDRGIARQGHAVLSQGETVGQVVSGTFSPTFEKALGMAFVPKALATVGTELEVVVRERALKAVVVSLPFYRRG